MIPWSEEAAEWTGLRYWEKWSSIPLGWAFLFIGEIAKQLFVSGRRLHQ